MDQDVTWHGGRPRPWTHCVRWGSSSQPPKGAQPPIFSTCLLCDQTAVWSKMPLGMEVGLGPGHIVLDGDPAPPKRGTATSPPTFGHCLLWSNGWMNRDATWKGGRPRPRRHCVRWGPSSPIKGAQQPPNFRPTSVVAKWLGGLGCHLLWLSPGDIVLDVDAPPC